MDLSAKARVAWVDSSKLALVFRGFVAILCRLLSRLERFCVDREECSQREIENGEYHSDYKPHKTADQ